jgi:hypothetical protein
VCGYDRFGFLQLFVIACQCGDVQIFSLCFKGASPEENVTLPFSEAKLTSIL